LQSATSFVDATRSRAKPAEHWLDCIVVEQLRLARGERGKVQAGARAEDLHFSVLRPSVVNAITNRGRPNWPAQLFSFSVKFFDATLQATRSSITLQCISQQLLYSEQVLSASP